MYTSNPTLIGLYIIQKCNARIITGDSLIKHMYKAISGCTHDEEPEEYYQQL